MRRSAIPRSPTAFWTDWCTMLTGLNYRANLSARRKAGVPPTAGREVVHERFPVNPQAAHGLVRCRARGGTGHEVALRRSFQTLLHLCLQAERHTGRVVLNAAEWTQALGKNPAWSEACLGELYRNHVCEGGGGGVEICDRFWPYEKQAGGAAAAPEA